jgi:hypothetical protein
VWVADDIEYVVVQNKPPPLLRADPRLEPCDVDRRDESVRWRETIEPGICNQVSKRTCLIGLGCRLFLLRRGDDRCHATFGEQNENTIELWAEDLGALAGLLVLQVIASQAPNATDVRQVTYSAPFPTLDGHRLLLTYDGAVLESDRDRCRCLAGVQVAGVSAHSRDISAASPRREPAKMWTLTMQRCARSGRQ